MYVLETLEKGLYWQYNGRKYKTLKDATKGAIAFVGTEPNRKATVYHILEGECCDIVVRVHAESGTTKVEEVKQNASIPPVNGWPIRPIEDEDNTPDNT